MIYFDNASTSYPKPEDVYREVDRCMREYGANPGRSGHKLSMQAGRVLLEARELIAELIKANKPDNIIFGQNVTDALNVVIKGLLKGGDHVITTSMEHNSVLRPLKSMEDQGVEITIIQCGENGELDTSDVERAIKPNTKAIISTHASNVTGTIMPLEALGKISAQNGLIFIVDSAQTAGVYDIDVNDMNIDILTFTGHKSLMGPQGVGGFYIKDGISLRRMREGGTGSMSESLLHPEILPDKYESGTPNTPGIAGLAAGLNFIKKTGIENIRKHEEKLTKHFIDRVEAIEGIKIYGPAPAKSRAPVVSLNLEGKTSADVSFILDSEYDIATRAGLHCAPLAHKTIGTFSEGTVRFSFGYFNTIDEVDRAVEALKSILKEVY